MVMQFRGMNPSRLATRIGMARQKQTVYSRILKPESSRDPDFWPRVAAQLGVTMEQLAGIEPLPWDIVTSSPRKASHGLAPALELLMDTLEDPATTTDQKEAARTAIMALFQVQHREFQP